MQFKAAGGQGGREVTPRAARLVVVGAETATTAEFRVYADRLVGAGQLGRIFVDECHMIITDAGY